MSPSEFAYTVLLKAPPLRAAANAVLRAIIPEEVAVKGARVCLNPDDPVVSGALTLRVYEREEIEFFHDCFQPGMTFVDIGANSGLYTALALSKGPKALLAVEPHGESRKFLEQTIHANARNGEKVHVSAFAASDLRASTLLYENPDNKGDNRLYADPLCPAKEAVETDTLDAICETAGIETVNFLKVDTQGAECRVIRGATNLLKHSPRCILMSEFWPYGLTACGDDPREYLALLEDLGFSLFELHGRHIIPILHEKLIAKTTGRKYANIVGFKTNGRSV